MYLFPQAFSINLKFLVPTIPKFKVVLSLAFHVKEAIFRNAVYELPALFFPTSKVTLVEKLSSKLYE